MSAAADHAARVPLTALAALRCCMPTRCFTGRWAGARCATRSAVCGSCLPTPRQSPLRGSPRGRRARPSAPRPRPPPPARRLRSPPASCAPCREACSRESSRLSSPSCPRTAPVLTQTKRLPHSLALARPPLVLARHLALAPPLALARHLALARPPPHPWPSLAPPRPSPSWPSPPWPSLGSRRVASRKPPPCSLPALLCARAWLVWRGERRRR